MKRRSVILFILIFIIGCQQQEDKLYPIDEDTSDGSYLLTRSMGNFFETNGTDEYLQRIITYLQLYSESHSFTSSFIEHYGTPLWHKTYSFPLDDYAVYVVPVLKNAEIGAIWVFEMDAFQTRHYVLPRPEEGNPNYSLSWMFDYFNVKLSLRNTNDKGQIVDFIQPPQSRVGIWIQYCNEIWAGYRDSNGVLHLEYQTTHCWSEYITTHPTTDNSGIGPKLPLFDPNGANGKLPVGKKPSKIFNSVRSLSEGDKVKLEKAVDDMLENCYAEAIYNYLINNNVGFNDVLINPKISGESMFGFDSHNLTFRDSECIDAGAVYHEMFHLFQNVVNPDASTNEVRGLMEYERTLFEDIAFMVKYADKKGKVEPENYDKRKSPWLHSMLTPSEEQDKYEKWMGGITKNFSTYPESISNEDFSRWKTFFQTYTTNSSYKQYDYNVSYSSVTINKAFDLAKNNCRN